MTCKFELGFEPIAAWLKAISAETRYLGLAETLLTAATSLPLVERGVTILSEQGQLFEAANAGLPRDLAEVILTRPPRENFKISEVLMQRAVETRQPIVADGSEVRSAFGGLEGEAVSALCIALSHKEHVVGMLYLEARAGSEAFSPPCVAVAAMLASQAAVSFELARLFTALRETHKWMTKGQQLGRMGSYRFNTRTRDSRGSKEIYELLDLDLNLRPVPFEAFLSRIHPDDLPNLEATIFGSMEARTPFRHEYRVVHGDGTVLDLAAVGEWDENDIGDLELEGIITDVTQAKAAQRALADADARLERASGLANLGEIAGSIIHEINQPLTAIIAGAEASIRWLNREIPDLAEARASMLRTVDAGQRATSVVQSLRSLARRSRLHFSEFAIDEAVEEALRLAHADIDRSGTVLRMRLGAPATIIWGDKVQLQQVVINLVRNATEAMRESGVRSRLLRVESSADDASVNVGFHDTGPGIEAEMRERLFEALYTTKSGGLGLGLAICRKIISAHEGRIWAQDNDPCGTSFRFTLPLKRRPDALQTNAEGTTVLG